MHLLILGGTAFLGRHCVEHAIRQGHTVTVLHRGRSHRDLFTNTPEVEEVIADRTDGLSALGDRTFDAVIDTCGYTPRVVERAARHLADRVQHYTFISSLSAYESPLTAGFDESAALATLADPEVEEVRPETYGGLKALCEAAVERHLPGRALHVRAGLIAGPYDYIPRLTWWIRRIARGGEILAPGRPDRRVQLIDARDIAEWTLRCAASGQAGAFNASSETFEFGRLLNALMQITGAEGHLTWVEEAFLVEQEVTPWSGMPLWLPEASNALFEANTSAAQRAGLRCRPIEETLTDMWRWLQAEGEPDLPALPMLDSRPKVGLTPEREAHLLAAWRRR